MNDQSRGLFDKYSESPEITEVPYDLGDGVIRVDKIQGGIVKGTFLVAKGYDKKIFASRDPMTDLIKLSVVDGELHQKLKSSFSSLNRAVAAIKSIYGVKDEVKADTRTGPANEKDLLEIAEYQLQNIHFRIERYGDKSRRLTTTFQNSNRTFFAPYYDSVAWIEIIAGERRGAWSSEQSIAEDILAQHKREQS